MVFPKIKWGESDTIFEMADKLLQESPIKKVGTPFGRDYSYVIEDESWKSDLDPKMASEVAKDMIPESLPFVRRISSVVEDDPNISRTPWGRDLVEIKKSLTFGATLHDANSQRTLLKEYLLKFIKDYGKRGVSLLGRDLRGVLSDKEIEEYNR